MISGNICGLCGEPLAGENLERALEEHLRTKHYLSYQDYYETMTLGTPTSPCWKCGAPRYSISPWLDNFYLPCSCRLDPDNKRGLLEVQGEIISVLKEFQSTLGRSKYYQYILSLSPLERQRFLVRNFKGASDLLQSLKRTGKLRIDKTHLIEVVSPLGFSGEISARNLGNLEMRPLEFKVALSPDGRYSLGDTGLYISLPEIIPFDNRHHSRASILNPAAKRSAKRLKLESGECIRFWATPNSSVRSILALQNAQGESVGLRELDLRTQWKVKFGILKTKDVLGRILEIYNEIFKYLAWIEDPVFILNSFKIPLPSLELGMILSWSWEDQDYENKGGTVIKLSIL